MIETGVFKLRDPFVVVGESCYYLYGTDVSAGSWVYTTWGCYKSDEKMRQRKRQRKDTLL